MKKLAVVLVALFCVNLGFPKTLINYVEEPPMQYDAVEVKPLFPGGLNEFMMFVMKNYQVPEDEEGISQTGILQMSMVIDTQGNITKVKVVKEVGKAGEEVKRVLGKCPKWTPGRNKGVNVPVLYTFNVTIK